MPIVTFLPMQTTIDVPAGTTVLQAAEKAGVYLRHVCGGQAICATCRCKAPVGDASLSPMGRVETKRLKELYAPTGTRLACQAEVKADVAVEVSVPRLGV